MTRASAARAGPGEASAGPRLAPGPLPSRLSTQRERPALLSWRAGILFSSPFRAPGLQGPPGASGGLQDVAPALFQCRRPERQASALARRLCSHRGVRIQGRPTTALSVRGPAGWPGRGPQSLPGPNRTGRWPIRRDEASVSCAQHSTPTPQSSRLCCPQPSPAPRAGSWPGRVSPPCFRGPRERRGERAALGGHLPAGGTPGLSLTASPCSPRRTQTRRLHRSRTPSALRGAGGPGETEADSLPALPSAPGPGARPHGAPGCLCRRWGACLRTPFHGPRQGPSTCLLCPTRRRPPKSSRVPGRAS